MAIFKGAATALVTPFYPDGKVNFVKLEELLEEQIANGIDALVICGTSGEASTLSHKEHLDAVRFAIDKVKGRVPVIVGAGSNRTDAAVCLSQEAERYGADAVLVVTPYYNKATQKGLKAHFGAVANAVKIPVIMYNVPSRTGCNILPETAAELNKNVKNIVGIKEASGNISQVAKLMNLTDGRIELYSGNDDQVLPILSLGGLGVISVLSNIAPKTTHDMVAEFLNGNIEKSREIQLKAIPLINALFCEVNPIPVKEAMNMLGKDVGPLRLPLTSMEPANRERLRQELIRFGFQVKQ